MIRQALAAQGIQTTEYLLDPIFPQDIAGFLQRNASAHQEMSAAIGASSQDLQDVDFNDEQAKAAWVNAHWLEHSTAESALNVNS